MNKNANGLDQNQSASTAWPWLVCALACPLIFNPLLIVGWVHASNVISGILQCAFYLAVTAGMVCAVVTVLVGKRQRRRLIFAVGLVACVLNALPMLYIFGTISDALKNSEIKRNAVIEQKPQVVLRRR